LVLSGGGSKGAFQIGVLKRWMGDLGFDYDIMCGVSVGALNIAGLARVPFGKPELAIKGLEDFWLKNVTGTSAIYKRWFPFGRLHSLWEKSIYDSTPLQTLVTSVIDLKNVATNGRRLAVGCVCLDTGEHVFGSEQDPEFVKWVLASSSYPVFFTPIEIGGKLYSDGGIVNITPLSQAIKMGATDIDVIICSDPWKRTEWTASRKVAVPDQVTRTLGLMSDQIARLDLEELVFKNVIADESVLYRHVRVRVCVPSRPLNVNSLTFEPRDTLALIKQGYEDADSYIVYD